MAPKALIEKSGKSVCGSVDPFHGPVLPSGQFYDRGGLLDQNDFGNPACSRIAFAVWRLGIPTGTGKFQLVIGLRQISWLPFP
jgi:hypothetical protein